MKKAMLAAIAMVVMTGCAAAPKVSAIQEGKPLLDRCNPYGYNPPEVHGWKTCPTDAQ